MNTTLIESLRGDLAALHQAGAIDEATKREFDAICPPERVKLGTLLASIARKAGALTDAEIELFNQRDKTMAAPTVDTTDWA